ncbi:glycosyltransferase family 2 protein [Halalkalicoccus ordinarius]|uniref:glycosyltransferase family 2 protein n=1 Tax=Halalkalicoccus ordinarius TaxID=3116651 RepID=UPI00300E6E0A
MYREHTISVIVPAYNEEGFIGNVIRDMPEFVDRIYVIDDCSTDGTWEEIQATVRSAEEERVKTQAPSGEFETAVTDGGTKSLLEQRAVVHGLSGRVVPIQHRENRGAGGAIKTGYLAALQDKVDISVTVDGDGQMDLSQMTTLLDPIVEGKADYAKGNRLLYADYRSNMPKWRFFGNSILTFLTKIASGYWKTMDPQNGYTAISHRALDNAEIEDMYEYYGYCNDLLVKLNAKGMRVADVALPAIYGEEESSIKYPEYIRKVSGMLLKNFLWRLKTRYLVLDFHPLALFYYFGAAMVTLGMVGGGWSVYVGLFGTESFFVRSSLSLMIFTMGSMFLMFAMLFDMQANESREVQVRE